MRELVYNLTRYCQTKPGLTEFFRAKDICLTGQGNQYRSKSRGLDLKFE